MIKKHLFLVSVLSLFVYCGSKQEITERIIFMEEGVEVVINHVKPFKIEGEVATFSLEEEFRINTERDEIAEIGLTDISHFDVDSERNIYLWPGPQSQKAIYKFDGDGKFEISFGDKGQGPGEIKFTSGFIVNHKDELIITDYGNKKYLNFDKNGNLIKEIRTDTNILTVFPLENGNHLIVKRFADPEADYIYQHVLILCDSEFEEITELDRQKIPNFLKTKRRTLAPYIFYYNISAGKIFTGNAVRGYEIWVYDFDGHMTRKVKKEFIRADVKEYIKEIRQPQHSEKYELPRHLPPFQTFSSDNEGRLLVITYEKAKNKGEYLIDIFNRNGVFVGRTSMKFLLARYEAQPMLTHFKVKGGRLYCLTEKVQGGKELVVHRIEWE